MPSTTVEVISIYGFGKFLMCVWVKERRVVKPPRERLISHAVEVRMVKNPLTYAQDYFVSVQDRRKARQVLEQKIVELYGGKSNWGDAFHHVVWMGDFNFRTQAASGSEAGRTCVCNGSECS